MEFLTKYPRCLAFYGFDCLMDTELRVNFQEEMNMVWHDLHLNDLERILLGNLLNKLLQSCVDTIH